jgi:hypothetical protein
MPQKNLENTGKEFSLEAQSNDFSVSFTYRQQISTHITGLNHKGGDVYECRNDFS